MNRERNKHPPRRSGTDTALYLSLSLLTGWLQARLADPGLAGTLLLPTDTAWSAFLASQVRACVGRQGWREPSRPGGEVCGARSDGVRQASAAADRHSSLLRPRPGVTCPPLAPQPGPLAPSPAPPPLPRPSPPMTWSPTPASSSRCWPTTFCPRWLAVRAACAQRPRAAVSTISPRINHTSPYHPASHPQHPQHHPHSHHHHHFPPRLGP